MKRNIMKKWMLILAVALCLNTVAFAEGEEPAAPAQVEQVNEEKKVEAPQPAEEKKVEAEKPAEPAPEAAAPAEEVSAPVEAEVSAEPEAEVPVEVTEAASEEIADEAAPAPAEDDVVEIEDYETPLGVTAAPAPFGANVKLQLRNQGEVYYGDMVTIEANITDATGAYDIRWEVDRHDENGWSVIDGQKGSSYGFVITESNVSYDYRVVLSGQA